MADGLKFSKDVCQVLATLCHISIDFVLDALAVPEDMLYCSHVIPKKRGGTRILSEPCEELKVVQGAFLHYLYKRNVLEARFFGGMPGRSVVGNARFHIWHSSSGAFLPSAMFHVDLKDAFPSGRDKRLAKMFAKMFPAKKFIRLAEKSPEKVTALQQEFVGLLLYCTTHQCCLPQGAATSPYLLNMLLGHKGMLKEIDKELKDKNGSFRVSIYVDDITVSSDKPMSWTCRRRIVAAIQRTGFRVNHTKTRYNERDRKAHCVTGISLSLDGDGKPKLTLSQKARDRWRAAIHRATLALEAGREPLSDQDGVDLQQAHGYASWITDVYAGYEVPSDVGVPVAAFKSVYAEYKRTHERY